MSIFNSAYNDVINGKDPQTFGLSGDDAIKYLKNYYAAKLGYEYGKMIGDGVAKVGIAFFDLFFYRMAYIFPGLIIFLLIFDYDTWIRINDIPYFIKYKLMDVMLVILLQIVFVVIPICLITYTLYMYLRGLELGNYILQKSVKQKLLFYGIGFYTIGISCIGIYMLFSIFVSDLFALFSKEFLWIKYLFFIYISWKLINSLINFHWSEYKVLKWSTESTFFKKGMNRALENNAKNLNLDQIQEIDIKDLDRTARRKSIRNLKFIIFTILMLIIYSFDKSNQHKKDLHQLTLQGKNYERPLVTSELILLYRESNDKKPHIAYLKTYIHRDSLFNEIEGTFKNGYYYIDFDKNTHWYNIEDQYKGMYKGGWLKMSEIKMGSVKREVYEKRKPKVRKTPDR